MKCRNCKGRANFHYNGKWFCQVCFRVFVSKQFQIPWREAFDFGPKVLEKYETVPNVNKQIRELKEWISV